MLNVAVNRKELHKRLKRAKKAYARNSSVEALECVHLIAAEGVLILESTNLDLFLTQKMAQEFHIYEPGEVLAPLDLIEATVDKIEEDWVALKLIDTDEKPLRLTFEVSGQVEGEIKCLSVDEFPLAYPSEVNELESLTLEGPQYLSGLKAVLPCATTDITARPTLGTVQHKFRADGTYRLAAADGYRLALFEGSDHAITTDRDLLVEREVAAKMVELMKGSETINLTVLERTYQEGDLFGAEGLSQLMKFEYGHDWLVTRSHVGKFPQVEQVVPQNQPFAAEIPPRVWKGFMMSEVYSSTDMGYFVFEPASKPDGKPRLVVSAYSADTGVVSNEYELGSLETGGQSFEIALNVKMLLNYRESFDGQTIRFGMSEPQSPIKIWSDENSQLLYVQMPMHSQRVNEASAR